MGKAFNTELEYVEMGEGTKQEVHLEVGHKKIKCGFIYGTVKCENTGKYLPNAIVKVINKKNNKGFLAITNKYGFYAVGVPPGKYLVFAMKCPP